MEKNKFVEKSIIKRDKEEEQIYLDLLNLHFKTVTYEKHPDAMMNLIFQEAFNKVLGANFAKKRISQRKEKRIKEAVLHQLRAKYGRWINLMNFKIKDKNRAFYRTNFNRVYKVEGLGILYGSPSHMLCGNIFYTSHCLERFEERADPFLYEPVKNRIRELYKTEPTSADIMIGLIMSTNYEYGVWKEFKYLNVQIGVLVLQDLGDVFIAKTFLTPDMLYEGMKERWYQPVLKVSTREIGEHFLDIDSFHSFADLLKHESRKIEKPTFIVDELTELMGRIQKEKENE